MASAGGQVKCSICWVGWFRVDLKIGKAALSWSGAARNRAALVTCCNYAPLALTGHKMCHWQNVYREWEKATVFVCIQKVSGLPFLATRPILHCTTAAAASAVECWQTQMHPTEVVEVLWVWGFRRNWDSELHVIDLFLGDYRKICKWWDGFPSHLQVFCPTIPFVLLVGVFGHARDLFSGIRKDVVSIWISQCCEEFAQIKLRIFDERQMASKEK